MAYSFYGILVEWSSYIKENQILIVLSATSPSIRDRVKYGEIMDGFFAAELVMGFLVEKRVLV